MILTHLRSVSAATKRVVRGHFSTCHCGQHNHSVLEPAETGDNVVAVHLDEDWLTDVDEYQFPYFDLKDYGGLQRGQTRYLMQLRPEPVGAFWYSTPRELEKISRDIQNTYGLLMARNGDINIYFPKRGKKEYYFRAERSL